MTSTILINGNTFTLPVEEAQRLVRALNAELHEAADAKDEAKRQHEKNSEIYGRLCKAESALASEQSVNKQAIKELRDLQVDFANAKQRISEFDSCIQKVAAALGACCGGVDGDQTEVGATTQVLLEKIGALKRALADREEALGEFSCSICGLDVPHYHPETAARVGDRLFYAYHSGDFRRATETITSVEWQEVIGALRHPFQQGASRLAYRISPALPVGVVTVGKMDHGPFIFKETSHGADVLTDGEHPLYAAPVVKKSACVCGNSSTLGVVHRADGPCFIYADPDKPDHAYGPSPV